METYTTVKFGEAWGRGVGRGGRGKYPGTQISKPVVQLSIN